MKTLRLASFGVRGFVGDSMTPTIVLDYASAFGTFMRGGRVLVGRDTRYSSPMIHSAVVSALLSTGCEVLDYGVCPTPMLQFFVKRNEAAGAVSVTGGHNAMGWNSLSLIGPDGALLEPVGGEEVLDHFHARSFASRKWDELGTHREVSGFAGDYFSRLGEMVSTEAIRARRFKVIIDPVGGAGCPYLDAFAERLGLDMIRVNGEPSGYLAREAEPRPRSAKQMASMIRPIKGDVGFVLSSDMGRLSLVTEVGEPASEEFTFAVVANYILGKLAGTLVTNICTTRMVEDIAARKEAPVVKTRVGQAYVMSKLADENGVIGGEGSGGVALTEFSNAFDGFLSMALILDAMAVGGLTLSELLSELPRYHIVKRGVTSDSVTAYLALDALKAHVEDVQEAELDLTDGIRLDWEDGWVHARTSRTQQLVRVISESKDEETAERRAAEVVRIIQQEI